MSFSGADVDGLDRTAAECRKGAQVCDEVRMVCEAIVAAASFFGPFGAAFIAYLKGVVIPWLKRISEALTLFAQVLSAHSASQRDASSSATSLPNYVTPAALPAGNTSDYPTVPLSIATASTYAGAAAGTSEHPPAGTTDTYLFGLVSVKHNADGALSDVTLREPGLLASHSNHFHIDRDSDGGFTGVSTEGSTSVLGGVLSSHQHGEIAPTYGSDGMLSGINADGTTEVSAGDTTVAQIRENAQLNYADGLPVFGSGRFDLTGAVSTDGNPVAATPGAATDGSGAVTGLPAGVTTPGVPDPTNDGLHYSATGGRFALSASYDPLGGDTFVAGSADIHGPLVSGGLSGDAGSAAAGYEVSAGPEAHIQGFFGTDTQANSGNGVSGGLFSADAGLGGLTGGVSVNNGDSGGYGTMDWGAAAGGGAYGLRSGDTYYSGASGEVGEFGVAVGAHGPAAPPTHGGPDGDRTASNPQPK